MATSIAEDLSRLPDELRAVARLVSDEGGLIGGVHQISQQNDPFEVYMSTMGLLEELQPNIRKVSDRETGLEMAGGGGSTDAGLAKAISIVEAAERYSNSVPRSNLRWATQDELGNEALDLDLMPRCSPAELRHPNCQARIAKPSDRIRWVKGWSFATKTPVWIPAVAVWLHLPAETPGERLCLPISTGSAAHTSLAKAVVNGLCEVVERDAIALTWLQRLPLTEIDFADAPDEVREAIRRADSSGRTHRFYDATTDVGIPTIYCVDTRPDDENVRHVVMCATDLDPAKAVLKIVREIASSRIGLEQGNLIPESTDDFVGVFHGAQYMGAAERASAFDFLTARPRATKLFGELASIAEPTFEDELRRVLALLTRAGVSPVAVDVTTSEAQIGGLYVVKTIIPELMPLSFAHRTRFLAHPRLYEAPALMGFSVNDESHINPYPQPFA